MGKGILEASDNHASKILFNKVTSAFKKNVLGTIHYQKYQNGISRNIEHFKETPRILEYNTTGLQQSRRIAAGEVLITETKKEDVNCIKTCLITGISNSRKFLSLALIF